MVVWATAGEISPQLQSILDTTVSDHEIGVIVQLREQVERKQFKKFKKKLRRQKLVKALRDKARKNETAMLPFMRGKGGKKIRNLWIINSFSLKATPSGIRELAKRPEVMEVRLDGVIPLPTTPEGAAATVEWNLSMVGADQVWAQGYTGQGVVVASMDSGVDYLHIDLSGNWRGGTNSWFDPHGEHSSPYDADGHGTGTMGIMVGQNTGTAAIGMAPDAQWIAVKIFNDAGTSSYSDIHLGYQWLLDPDSDPLTDDAPDIVNNSWGFPETINSCMTEFQADIETLVNLDINVVFSAGNQGGSYASISPANNAGVFSVGAVDQTQLIASSSNQGPSACSQEIYPTAVAPGILVRSADRTFGGIVPDATIQLSGTSFAAPHISGAMALLLSSNPDLTAEQLQIAITQTSTDLGDTGADNVYGYGLLNVPDALAYASSPWPCDDVDADGFFLQSYCGKTADCDDSNPRIYPGAPELIFDGIDQNCDGQDLKTLIPAIKLLLL